MSKRKNLEMDVYDDYILCGSVLKPTRPSSQKNFIIKCSSCEGIFSSLESFIVHVAEDDCTAEKESIKVEGKKNTNNTEDDEEGEEFMELDPLVLIKEELSHHEGLSDGNDDVNKLQKDSGESLNYVNENAVAQFGNIEEYYEDSYNDSEDNESVEEKNKMTKQVTGIKKEINILKQRQEEMCKLIAESNVLLRRNLNLFEVTQTIFPIMSDDDLKQLDINLGTSKRHEIVGAMQKILSCNIKNIDRIISKDIILNYNYDGMKDKKSLKTYANFVNAIYDAIKMEGLSYEEFKTQLRLIFRKIKNTTNKQNCRKRKEIIKS